MGWIINKNCESCKHLKCMGGSYWDPPEIYCDIELDEYMLPEEEMAENDMLDENGKPLVCPQHREAPEKDPYYYEEDR